ncbi:MAG: hypothetical protein ACOYO1_19065 [Bacteroidales bacterium]
MTVLYIILAILAIVFLKFFIYNYKTSSFFNSVILDYINFRESGYSKFDSNKMIISKKLCGNVNHSFSPKSIQLIRDFDIVDTIQFLVWFKNSKNLNIESIPKLTNTGLKTNKRFNLLNYELKKKHLDYLNSKPDLRNNSSEISDEFEELGYNLKNDFDLF